MNKDTIEVPRVWLERLVELKDKVRSSEGEISKLGWESHLFGYIESVKYLLEK